jgi:hypothetical protein
MAGYWREKNNFTAGEVSPLMYGRRDFERYKNGSRAIKNMIVATQGPVSRRAGSEYIASLSDFGLDTTNPQVRFVEFVFNESQAYALLFFRHTSGVVRVLFPVNDGLLAYPDPAPEECPTGTPVSYTPGDVVYLDMPTGWDIENFDYAQSGDYLYCAQGTLKPHVIIRHGLYCWTVEELTFTDQPTDWSDTFGWPETVAFIQQRLVFGGSLKDRQTVWCTRAGDFSHLGQLGATLVDADAITFTLDSGTQNRIVWMQTVKGLHIGTIGNEWVVTGNGQAALTPTGGVLTQNSTNQGSEKIKPLRIGLTTLFVEKHGRVINEFIYDYNYDSYKASDVTILSPHLTEEYSIKRWAYQQTPNSVVWVVRSDGALLGLTYQRQHNVVAWHRHDTKGEFIDVCSIPGVNREDDLWFVVKRVIGGVDKYYIEKKAEEFKGPDTKDGRFLDSFMYYEGTPTATIAGLEHLEGEEVYILTNGYVHPPKVVVDGEITLNKPATNVLVGLYYYSEVRPLLDPVPTKEGSSALSRYKILSMQLELYRSLGFEIGIVNEQGEEEVEEKPFRKPYHSTGQAVPLFTGVYEVDGFEGMVRNIEYFIRQRQPLPLTVISVVDNVEVVL